MNVIWIVADTFRSDHLGAYGNRTIRTPTLDALAARSVRFDRHYIASFPTMPTRADHATGRWSMSFMGWEAMPEGQTTLAEILAEAGYHTAAVTDTPFYLRGDMNYDKGFQSFFFHPGQDAQFPEEMMYIHRHESQDIRAAWRHESDRNAHKRLRKPPSGSSATTRKTSFCMSTPGTPTNRGTRPNTTQSPTGRDTTEK